MKIINTLKKLFGDQTDLQVGAITEENSKVLAEAAASTERHRKIYDENNFTLQIFVAVGGQQPRRKAK